FTSLPPSLLSTFLSRWPWLRPPATAVVSWFYAIFGGCFPVNWSADRMVMVLGSGCGSRWWRWVSDNFPSNLCRERVGDDGIGDGDGDGVTEGSEVIDEALGAIGYTFYLSPK
ncbi:hypothetical protein M8C21_033594, partial [Ambrosia artemisiifolia]